MAPGAAFAIGTVTVEFTDRPEKNVSHGLEKYWDKEKKTIVIAAKVAPRKLPIPWEPEAGFGAVTPEGTVVLNEEMRPYLGLTDEDVRAIARTVQQETRRRLQVYRGDRPPPPIRDRTIILTDDGLATGLTMIAAIRAVRSAQPRRVLVAVPVAPRSSLQRVAAEAEAVPVAVAGGGAALSPSRTEGWNTLRPLGSAARTASATSSATAWDTGLARIRTHRRIR